MGFRLRNAGTGAVRECAISVGEHVWVTGRDGEYVVMGLDRESGKLQVLRMGNLGGLESVPMDSVRAVLAPKSGAAA